eukprot:1660522-Pleurochrysis_carterae.AAC.1
MRQTWAEMLSGRWGDANFKGKPCARVFVERRLAREFISSFDHQNARLRSLLVSLHCDFGVHRRDQGRADRERSPQEGPLEVLGQPVRIAPTPLTIIITTTTIARPPRGYGK